MVFGLRKVHMVGLIAVQVGVKVDALVVVVDDLGSRVRLLQR